jgi:hypothetical protein
MEERDIWRLAARLIKMFDDGAEMASAMYADRALAQGDQERMREWNRITAAINSLQRGGSQSRKTAN